MQFGRVYLSSAWMWALLVVPMWIVLALCAHWEPVMRDGWGHLAWARDRGTDLGSLYQFTEDNYLHENPRLGQLITQLLYAWGPSHAIATPLVEIGALILLTALAIGRWPAVRRSDDARVAILIAAIIAACAPQLGPVLLYRPYAGNYVYGLAVNLAWLVPYRLALTSAGPARGYLAIPMLVLGAAAGLCNEHTGLAMLALAAMATSLMIRRRDRRGWWMAAGLIGFAAGYVVLLTAPAQHERYFGLAEQASVIDRIWARGVAGNLAVIGELPGAMIWALPLIAIGLVEWRARRPAVARWTPLALIAAAVACMMTLLASPKLGQRLDFASVALVAAGLAGWLVVAVQRTWAWRSGMALATIALVTVAIRMLAIYAVVGPIGEARRARIVQASPGTALAVPPYPFATGRYFLGDDFIMAEVRQLVARNWRLAAVDLAPAR